MINKISVTELVVKEGYPGTYQNATDRAYLRLFAEVSVLISKDQLQNGKIDFSWKKTGENPSHETWQAEANIEIKDRFKN